jgi:hypothetical protein
MFRLTTSSCYRQIIGVSGGRACTLCRPLPPSSYGVKKAVVCATMTDLSPCPTTSMGDEMKRLTVTISVLVLTGYQNLRHAVSKVAPS